MSRSKGFWKAAVTNQSPGSGPLRAAVDICDSLRRKQQRGLGGISLTQQQSRVHQSTARRRLRVIPRR
jgi:hypothetical protein